MRNIFPDHLKTKFKYPSSSSIPVALLKYTGKFQGFVSESKISFSKDSLPLYCMIQAGFQYTVKTRIVDESFTQGMAGDTLLLLLFDRNSISYLVIDRQRQKAVVLKDFRLTGSNNPFTADEYKTGFFSQLMEEDELLKDLQPRQVILSVYSSLFSLVPDPLFSKEQLKEIVSLTCNVKEEHRYYADAIRSANAHLVYAVSEDLLKETGSHFNEASLFFAGSGFIEYLIRLYKLDNSPKVSVLVRSEDIDICITQGGDLKLYNSFHYQTSEDLMYYLLFTMEQLQINPDQDTVIFYGEIEKTSSHWMLAHKYIRNIKLGERPELLDYSYGFDRLSSHQYAGLYHQYLCVL